MTSDGKMEKLKGLLESEYEWPTAYVFKFIVPKEKISEVEKLFPGHPLEKKASSKGNYTSVTITIELDSADHVIAIYEQAAGVEGLIAL